MATVDRQSLREEFDRLKGRFGELRDSGAMGGESRALFEALLLLFEVLLAVFLERRTPKTAANSGLPPSQAPDDATALPRPGAKGKGPAQRAAAAANTRTVETVATAPAEVCGRCGGALRGVPCRGHERRTRIDIVFEKTVAHVDAEIKHCPACRTRVRGAFPTDMHGPLQYGAGIKAYAVHLLVAQAVSLKRVAQSLATLIGRPVAEATLLDWVLRTHEALGTWQRRAVDRLLDSPALHADETSLRVAGANHWIHVYSAGDTTLKVLHPKRGRAAIDAIGVLPRYGGVVVHDCWASYLGYDHCGHALCGAHLLRELAFAVDAHGYAWARLVKRLLRNTCRTVAQRDDRRLTNAEYRALRKHYRTLLTRGARELPPLPPRRKGRRGPVAKSDAHNLWERLRKHETAVLLFAANPDVPFTNNRAERDLRMSKVKQKVSGCFRTAKFAEAYCRISSYLQTMAYQGYNPLVALQWAFSGRATEIGGE